MLTSFTQLASDSENEGEPGTDAEPSMYSSRTLLITHPARKCVFEFLRVIMTDSLTSPTSAKSLGVIDAILEVRCSECYLVGEWLNSQAICLINIMLLQTAVLFPKSAYICFQC